MILKSEEAKKLYCPWCYAAQEGETSLRCEAEMCMAWKEFEHTDDPSTCKGYCKLIEKHD